MKDSKAAVSAAFQLQDFEGERMGQGRSYFFVDQPFF
jgi:hypothetical protein